MNPPQKTKIPTDEKFQAWLAADDFIPKHTPGHMQRQMNTLTRYEILGYLESAYSLGRAAGRAEGREEQREMLDTLFHIAYSVKSCRAGDGDDRSWEEAACYCENMAEKFRDRWEAIREQGDR